MPPAGALISAAASAALVGAAKVSVLGLAVGFPSIAATFIGSLALSLIGQALQPKPKKPTIATPFSAEAESRTAMIRQAVLPRRRVYGEVRISGALTFYETTNGNKNHHYVVTLCDGPVAGIGTVWLDDQPVYDDQIGEDGWVTDGDFADKVRIKKHLGSLSQAADPDLIGAVSRLDSNFRGQGVAYVYVEVDWDRDTFPNGLPDLSAWVRGQEVTDPRTAAVGWTDNAQLALRHFLMDPVTSGLGVMPADLDATVWDAGANTCDEIADVLQVDHDVASVDVDTGRFTLEDAVLRFATGDQVEVSSTGALPAGLSASTDYFVIIDREAEVPRLALADSLAEARARVSLDITDAGSGLMTISKTGEPRYTAAGMVTADKAPFENIEDLLSAMGGSLTTGGSGWRAGPGHYVAATVTFDEDDMVSTIKVSTRHPRRDRFNAVIGQYVPGAQSDGQPVSYPVVAPLTYQTADGGTRVPATLDLPFTNRPATAQRLARRHLEAHRRERTVEVTVNLRGLLVQPGDVVGISNALRSWTAKPFRVVVWRLNAGPDGGMAVGLTLRETHADVDAWNPANDETLFQPGPRGVAGTYAKPAAPTGLNVSSEQRPTAAGDETFLATVAWDPPADGFVTGGGRIEVQWKENASATWRPSWTVGGADTQALIYQLEKGVKYDLRVRSVNSLGRNSNWQSLFGFTVTSPAGATTQLDYGAFSDSVGTNLDYGAWDETVTIELDYEEFA